MPLMVSVNELTPGMRLAEGVVVNGRVLLQGGRELTPTDIRVLRRRFPDQSVRVGDALLDDLFDFEDDSHDREVALKVQKQISSCLSSVASRFLDRASLGNVQLGALQGTIRETMQYIENNPVSAALVTRCLDGEGYLSAHIGNVFYLSMLLAFREFDYVMRERMRQLTARCSDTSFASDMVPLALGTLLMDLGIVPIQHLLTADRELTEDERGAIREHPVTGAEMLPRSVSALVRMIARTHHENMRGTGYPQGKSGSKIHVFSRIVRIADAFDSATAEGVYAQARTSARVLWEMSQGPYREHYDSFLMRAFASLIQPFPIGAKLRLTDGRMAVVVRYNRGAPFDPTVIIAFDADGRRLPRERFVGPLRLSTCQELRYAAFGPQDLGFLYDATEPPPAQTNGFATAFEAVYP